ncbi:Protein of unknown function [Pyronema omphalodes CBS 100304]|uniref:Uncharacterized protein n=1 Tax=Pyronema omphalodes (strain CBS 100304) TaxID=1076935 RepID=U4KYV2_PYROM|nr:Protein of unknown function [Pyronema omphalodes CBS 100304]
MIRKAKKITRLSQQTGLHYVRPAVIMFGYLRT